MRKNLVNYRSTIMLFMAMMLAAVANAQKTAIADGPWESNATWGGAPPTAGQSVTINDGVDVTVSSAAQCSSIRFRNASGSITVNSTFTLTVGTTITLESLNAGNTAATLAGAGTIDCASLIVGFNQTSPTTTDRSTILTSNVATLNVSGNVTVRSEDNGNIQNNASLSVGAVGVATISVGGSLILSTDSDGGQIPTSTLNLNNGGRLSLTGATPVSIVGTGNYVFDVDGTSARVTYGGADQPVFPSTYARILINGSGTKTLSAVTTINFGLELHAGVLITSDFLTIGNSSPGISRLGGTMTGVIQGANSYNISYSGAGTKITGDELSGTNLRDFTLGSGSVVILNQNLQVGRDLGIGNDCTLDLGSFILEGGTNFNMGSNTLLRIGGTNSFPAGFNAWSGSSNNSVVEFYGTNQLVDFLPSGSYTNVILSGSGVKTFVGETILQKLSIREAATTAGTPPVYGASAVLEYKGSVPQATNIEFVGNGANPTNVTVDNISGVTLSEAKAINGALTLTNGYLTTTETNVLTINSAGTSTTQNGAFVNGPLAKVHASTDEFRFYVGNIARGLRPAGITPQNATATTYTASFKTGNPKSISASLSGGITQLSSCEYWDISQTAGSTSARVMLSWNAAGNNCGTTPYITNTGTLVVAHYNGTSWTNEGQSAVTGSAPGGGSITSNNFLSTFSPFTLGTTNAFNNPLPVMFADVKAFQKNNGVQIEWTNLTERDLIKYQVEHSSNGQSFTSVVNEQLPRSNNNDKESYVAFDASPLNAANFYRVKVYEIGGKIIYSKILKVDINAKQGAVAIYPNPVEGRQLSLSMNAKQGQYTLKVFNATGQEVYVQRMAHQGGSITQAVDLPASVKPGMYNIVITGNDFREVKTFVVR